MENGLTQHGVRGNQKEKNSKDQSSCFHERLGLLVQEKQSLLEVVVCCLEFWSYLRVHLP